MLRAGLCKDFKAAFNREFYVDFVRKVWLELFLSELFLLVTSLVLTLAGMIVFCMGQYVAAGWVMMARFHLMYQVYALYLQRGGIPPAVKDETILS